MKSTAPIIEISKITNQGENPAFLALMHRHLQKSLPAIVDTNAQTFNVSIDLLDMILPDEILNSIESFEVSYAKGWRHAD